MQNTALKLKGTWKTWMGAIAVLIGLAPACLAEGPNAVPVGTWPIVAVSLSLALAAIAAGAVAWHWRLRTLLAKQKQELESIYRTKIEETEQTNGDLLDICEQLRRFAERDALTGLWNRRVILDLLRGEVDRSRRDGSPLSLILIDLDHFKDVNDTYGHASGDAVLRELSALFLRSVRRYDWVGRYGGEEFLVILPGANFENARARAEQIRQAVQVAVIQDGSRSLKITASFGVASGFPSAAEALIDASDAALYRAKDNGRNCVMVSEIEPPIGPNGNLI